MPSGKVGDCSLSLAFALQTHFRLVTNLQRPKTTGVVWLLTMWPGMKLRSP